MAAGSKPVIIASRWRVRRVKEPRWMHVPSQHVLVKISVDFRDPITALGVEADVSGVRCIVIEAEPHPARISERFSERPRLVE